jgi:acetyltransferase-like isoleucine patch superfamily enzyme
VVLFTKAIPYFSFLYKTDDYQHRLNFSFWFKQKVLNFGGNRHCYWPVHWTSTVFDPENIFVGVDSYPGYNGGAYITGSGKLVIGDYCIFAKNVIIVTANHDLYDSRIRIPEPVTIGNYCWFGGGAKIMPGVVLGDYTIVAAGAVVTKSFTEGYCVLAGVPAVPVKKLDPKKCVHYEHKEKYHGYLTAKKYNAKKIKKDE